MDRLEVGQLERTPIDIEVHDTTIDGHDDNPVIAEDVDEPSQEAITSRKAIDMEKCIVFTENIMSLLHQLHGDKCNRPGCGRNCVFKKTYVGTCLVVSWRCSAGHIGGRWASQPTCDKLRAGNLLLASSILLSGNSFTKVGLLFKFLNLQYFSSTLFYRYQNLYVAPAVNDYWKSMQKDLWQERAGKDVILSGDGRNDSPGHSAQYCTYTLADMETKTILHLEIVDVREVEGRKSANMERIGFERGMDSLLASEMNITEVVTDGHSEIGALFSKYINIVPTRQKNFCVQLLLYYERCSSSWFEMIAEFNRLSQD